MSKTPETDADYDAVEIVCEDPYCVSWAEKEGKAVRVVSLEFAQRMERERNEARGTANALRGAAERVFGTLPFPRRFKWEEGKPWEGRP